MELYTELLCHILSKQPLQCTFPQQTEPFSALIESESYIALSKIKSILEDDTLSDRSCFTQIEEIICVFENLGTYCGNRHDF